MVTRRAPSPSVLDWSQLQFFRQVAGSSTLAEAAIRIGVTASAVSQRLSSLENSAGAALLIRSRHGLRLTDIGRQTLVACDEMHVAALRAAEAMKPDEGMTGTLRITCPQGLADAVIVPILARFLRRHPAIGYDLLATDQHLDLRSAGVDLALRFGWVRDGDYVAKRLVTYREVLCASPDYLDLHGTPVEPRDLTRHSWVGYAPFGHAQRLVFNKPGGGVCRVEVAARISTTSATSIASWLCAGVGISRQPEPVVREHLRAGRLVEVLADFSLPGPSLYAAYVKRGGTSRARPLLQYLSEELRVDAVQQGASTEVAHALQHRRPG